MRAAAAGVRSVPRGRRGLSQLAWLDAPRAGEARWRGLRRQVLYAGRANRMQKATEVVSMLAGQQPLDAGRALAGWPREYAAYMGLLARNGEFAEVEALYEQAAAAKSMTEGVVGAYMQALERFGNAALAQGLFARMIDVMLLRPGTRSFSALVRAHGRMGKPELAQGVVEYVEEKLGHVQNRLHRDLMVAWAYNGRMDACEELLEIGRGATRTAPLGNDAFVWQAMLLAAFHARDPEAALDILRRMGVEGCPVTTTARCLVAATLMRVDGPNSPDLRACKEKWTECDVLWHTAARAQLPVELLVGHRLRFEIDPALSDAAFPFDKPYLMRVQPRRGTEDELLLERGFSQTTAVLDAADMLAPLVDSVLDRWEAATATGGTHRAGFTERTAREILALQRQVEIAQQRRAPLARGTEGAMRLSPAVLALLGVPDAQEGDKETHAAAEVLDPLAADMADEAGLVGGIDVADPARSASSADEDMRSDFTSSVANANGDDDAFLSTMLAGRESSDDDDSTPADRPPPPSDQGRNPLRMEIAAEELASIHRELGENMELDDVELDSLLAGADDMDLLDLEEVMDDVEDDGETAADDNDGEGGGDDDDDGSSMASRIH